MLLLPPSEAKAPGGRGAWTVDDGLFGAALAAPRRAVADALAALGTGTGGRALTGVRGQRAEVEAAANAAVVGAPVRPAGERFRGVVWDHLDVPTLAPAARRRAARVLVVSPLGGLWALGDRVPDHKLKMGATLPGVGPLAAHWRAVLPTALAGMAGRGPVVDLLTVDHRRAVPLDGLAARVVRVEFTAADGRGAAGHAAKAAKGVVARRLLEAGGDPVAAADGFTWDGWVATVRGPDLVEVRAPG